MQFCPKCRTEYTDDAVTCSDCGAVLVAYLPPEEKSGDDHPGEKTEFVALRTYSMRMYAEMIVDALANEDIPAFIKSNETFGPGTGLGVISPARVVVWVPKDRADEAAEIADNILDANQ
jgi:hypothetical protein